MSTCGFAGASHGCEELITDVSKAGSGAGSSLVSGSRCRPCVRSIAGAATPATHARCVGETPQTTRYEGAPPPCDRTRQTPRPCPTLLLTHGPVVLRAVAGVRGHGGGELVAAAALRQGGF